jgi:hypothetical protein
VQPELGREISDRVALRLWVSSREPCILRPDIAIEAEQYLVILLQIGGILGSGHQAALANIAQEIDRIVIILLPQLGVDLAIEFLGFGMPAPPDVEGQLTQATDPRGNRRKDQIGGGNRHGTSL